MGRRICNHARKLSIPLTRHSLLRLQDHICMFCMIVPFDLRVIVMLVLVFSSKDHLQSHHFPSL